MVTKTDPSGNEEDAPLARSMHRYYEQRAPEYDDWYDRRGRYDDPATNDAWHAEVRALEGYADSFAGGLALDLACGTGRWTPHLAATGKVVGADYSPAMLAQTRQRMTGAGLADRLTLVRADAYTLPFADAAFDRVFFGFWLSHVPLERVSWFLAEIARVTQPSGRIMIFDSLLPTGAEQVQVQRRPLKDGSQHEVLKVYYSPDTLAAALAPYGQVSLAVSTGRYFVVAKIEIGPVRLDRA